MRRGPELTPPIPRAVPVKPELLAESPTQSLAAASAAEVTPKLRRSSEKRTMSKIMA